MSILDLAYHRIDKKYGELEATGNHSRGVLAGLNDALETIDILTMELEGRLPALDDVREYLKEQERNAHRQPRPPRQGDRKMNQTKNEGDN